MTNHHVVKNVPEYPFVSLALAGTEWFDGVVAGVDSVRDLALIRTLKCGVPLRLREENGQTRVGDAVFTVGHPKGVLSYSATDGMISNIWMGMMGTRKEIQHTATTTGGNSGGPLIAFTGRDVVGVHTSSLSDPGDFGFAIHFDEVRHFIDDVTRGEQDLCE